MSDRTANWLIGFLIVLFAIGLPTLLVWTTSRNTRDGIASCNATAKLITNASDHSYTNGTCLVVIDGKVHEVNQ